ncbi:MAG: DUF2169 family type VI secretion system accessory protein [Methylomonas sp.]
MLQLLNHTPFPASLSVFSDLDGVECAYAVAKASFELKAGGPVLAEQQFPLIGTDVYWGEPDKTSLRHAGEFSLPKPATDVVLIGNAIAPRDNTRVAEVSLSVGPVSKTLRLFGNRRWQKTDFGWEATSPEIWERMPLRWELAFGGVAPSEGDKPPEFEARNPVGKGFNGRDDGKWEGSPLPNIEDPAQLIRHPSDRPAPACFAPVAPAWSPRREYAGTYDETWQKKRAPYMPTDFDPRFFQTATSGLIAPSYLSGGEPVEVVGCTAGKPLRFQLPACTLAMVFDFDGRQTPYYPKLETVLIEPDVGRVQLLWRVGIKVDKHLLKLREVAVHCREYRNKPQES